MYLPAAGTIAGVALPPGWYSLYAIPNPQTWQIVINAEARRWGTPIDDAVRARDLGIGTVPAKVETAVEDLLLMRLIKQTADHAELIVQWDRTRVRIPVTLGNR